MSATQLVLACLISALPGPPGISYEDAYLQLFPVDKTKCPTIDPVRDIAYHLFTRNNPLMPDILKIGDDDALAHSHMNFADPTVIFFHAFFESSTATTSWIIKTAYLQRKQHNIILLNAPRLEAGPWYVTASRNTRVVGEYTATFVDYLVSRGLQLKSLHLLGLSLGAQMAGVTGSNVRSGKIPRITGMDPAGPIFTKLPNSLKLDRSDAEFVDVIHSDAGIFGYPRPIGHVDFWPNQGISPQPGCMFPEIKQRRPDNNIIELFFCSHWRSYQFFAESVVNENGFLSLSCNSWQEYASGKCNPNQQPINMGYGIPVTARGNYYLTTNPTSPFSLEGNPDTLAQSKDRVRDNYFPTTNSDFQIALQENVKSSQNEQYGAPDYYDFGKKIKFEPILQESPKYGESNGYYRTTNPELQNASAENSNNVTDNKYSTNVRYPYGTENPQPQVPLEENPKSFMMNRYVYY